MTNTVKVLLVGDSSVGKTTMINKIRNDGSVQQKPTTEVKMESIILNTQEGEMNLEIRDSPGKEAFQAFSINHVSDVDIVFIVFDLSDPITFENIFSWYDSVSSKSDDVIVYFLGNKNDLERKVNVEVNQYLKDYVTLPFKYFEMSAKNGDGIQTILNSVYSDAFSVNKTKDKIVTPQNSRCCIIL